MFDIVIVAVVSASVTVFMMLSIPYLRARVQAMASEPTQRILADFRREQEQRLADYRHGQDQILAAINADHERRAAEFSLFKRRQHVVYARLYAELRKACDGYAGVV